MFSARISWPLWVVSRYHCHEQEGYPKPRSSTNKHVNAGYFEIFLETVPIGVFLGRVAGAFFEARRVLHVHCTMWTNFLRTSFRRNDFKLSHYWEDLKIK